MSIFANTSLVNYSISLLKLNKDEQLVNKRTRSFDNKLVIKNKNNSSSSKKILI